MSRKFLFTWMIMFLLFLASCDALQGTQQSNQNELQESHQSNNQLVDEADPLDEGPDETELEPEKPKLYFKEATLTAVGDIMMHSPQIPAGYNTQTKAYNYDHFFSEVKPLLSAGDWVIGNLETPLAGAEQGYSGYPQFNAPEALADALKLAGINILSTANNHSLDRREDGVLKTIDHLRESGLLFTGTAQSKDESDELLIVTKNDISMAILSYTYGTNGIPVPEGKDYLVNLINEEKMIEVIRRARNEKVDVVTIALHFGLEYQREPTNAQKELVRTLIASGADIILGSHPHVVQPYEKIEVTTDQGQSRTGFVIYSLGNFISNQGPAQGTAKYTDVGLILNLKIQKQFPEGIIRITEIDPIHTWVHKYHDPELQRRNYRIIPIESTVTTKSDDQLSDNEYKLLKEYLVEMDEHLKSLLLPGKQKDEAVTSDVYR
jgi:poly-gamma-glutamate capsule biosynthesis protein CapA/YwtB (metallophosphatase superfamily)